MEQRSAGQCFHDIVGRHVIFFKSLFHDAGADLFADKFGNSGYFERMCQPGTYEIAAIQRKNLCFILQSSERGTVDDPIIITFHFTSQRRQAACPMCIGNSFFTDQMIPFKSVHNQSLRFPHYSMKHSVFTVMTVALLLRNV